MNAIGSHDGALAYFRKMVQDSFDVFRIDIQALGGDERVLLSAAEIESAFAIELAEIACREPRAVACGDALASHEDFTVGCEHQFLTFQNLSDRARARIERMVH